MESNNMEIVNVSCKEEYICISNTYVTYKCKECGAESVPASINQLLRRACKCPKQCHNFMWTYNACYDAAKQCKCSTEFRTLYGGAYCAAHKNGWLKDYIWFEKPTRESLKWDYKNTYEEAKKYNSRYSFSLGASGAYKVAKNRGWLDDYSWFEKSYQNVQHNDIVKKIYERLEKFPDLYFEETEFSHYTTGRGVNITIHCKKHPEEIIMRTLRSFLYGRVPDISYCKRCVSETSTKYKNFDEMIEALKKYKTLKEVRKYDSCLITNLSKTKEGKKYLDMLDRENSAWKRGIYSYKFTLLDKKYIYVGLTCNFKKRDIDHHKSKDSSVLKFAEKHNVVIPKMKKETEYIDWDLASRKESEYMEKYQSEGYILINQRPGGGLGGIVLKNLYTIKEAKEDIQKNKYKNINDISHRNSSLYNQICRHINDGDEGWDGLLPHKTRKDPNHWTRERVKEIFMQFDSIAEMSKSGYGSAYRAYRRKYRNDSELNNIVTSKFNKIFHKKECRRIGMFDDGENLIYEYDSVFDVSSEIIGFSTLSRALSGNKKARGYYWRYI